MAIIRVRVLLVPTKGQKQAFYESAYYADLMYNEALKWNIEYYEAEGKFYSFYEMCHMVTQFRRENPDFDKVSVFVLKDAVHNLRIAFDRFRDGVSGFPHKKKTGKKLSFAVRSESISIGKNTVKISKIGATHVDIKVVLG